MRNTLVRKRVRVISPFTYALLSEMCFSLSLQLYILCFSVILTQPALSLGSACVCGCADVVMRGCRCVPVHDCAVALGLEALRDFIFRRGCSIACPAIAVWNMALLKMIPS